MSKTATLRREALNEAVVPKLAAQRLLESVVAIGDDATNLSQRRQAFLAVLTEVVDADAGQWAWGRGTPNGASVLPVAIIDCGMSRTQRTALASWVLDPEAERLFHARVHARRGKQACVTSTRQDIIPDAEWQARPIMRQCLKRAGFDGWLHSVRYSAPDTWSSLMLYRKVGRIPFDPQQAELADLAMSSVTWMHSTNEEILPPQALVGLKPRQRMVMLMLLDGQTRRSIALQLGITEDTVSDHVKAIYRHFHVGSASELAAIFLRGK